MSTISFQFRMNKTHCNKFLSVAAWITRPDNVVVRNNRGLYILLLLFYFLFFLSSANPSHFCIYNSKYHTAEIGVAVGYVRFKF